VCVLSLQCSVPHTSYFTKTGNLLDKKNKICLGSNGRFGFNQRHTKDKAIKKGRTPKRPPFI